MNCYRGLTGNLQGSPLTVANVPRFSNLHLEYVSLGARIAPRQPTLGIKSKLSCMHMVSRRMSVRTADCETADCKTQAPDITCGRLDSSKVARRPKSTLQKI